MVEGIFEITAYFKKLKFFTIYKKIIQKISQTHHTFALNLKKKLYSWSEFIRRHVRLKINVFYSTSSTSFILAHINTNMSVCVL